MTPAIVVRTDALPGYMERLQVSGPYALALHMHRTSISTARRIIRGDCGANEGFIADLLELCAPLGATFESLFKINKKVTS